MNNIFEENTFDFVIDAIDTFNFKIELIEYCLKNNIKIISSFHSLNKILNTSVSSINLSEIAAGIKFPELNNTPITAIIATKNPIAENLAPFFRVDLIDLPST